MKDIFHLTGKGIGVAVIDTGIFPHVDFDNRIIARSEEHTSELQSQR